MDIKKRMQLKRRFTLDLDRVWLRRALDHACVDNARYVVQCLDISAFLWYECPREAIMRHRFVNAIYYHVVMPSYNGVVYLELLSQSTMLQHASQWRDHYEVDEPFGKFKSGLVGTTV